ncbi:hypothetical protein CR513_58339, partial [Mucuna pruriens]
MVSLISKQTCMLATYPFVVGGGGFPFESQIAHNQWSLHEGQRCCWDVLIVGLQSSHLTRYLRTLYPCERFEDCNHDGGKQVLQQLPQQSSSVPPNQPFNCNWPGILQSTLVYGTRGAIPYDVFLIEILENREKFFIRGTAPDKLLSEDAQDNQQTPEHALKRANITWNRSFKMIIGKIPGNKQIRLATSSRKQEIMWTPKLEINSQHYCMHQSSSIQDFKIGTVSNAVRYAASQIIASHITEKSGTAGLHSNRVVLESHQRVYFAQDR